MRASLLTLCLLTAAATSAQAEVIPGLEVIDPSPKQMRQLQALTPSAVKTSITISDDDLEPVAVLTTEKAWRSKGGFADKVRADNFLRAFVVKATGDVRFQLYQEVTYSGEWRRITSVNYATPSGPIATEVTPIDREVVTCSYGPCVHREIIGFDVPREQLDRIAANYSQGNSPMWRFRFKAQSGLDWEDRISPAEVSGLLEAVDDYAKRIGGSE